MVRLRAKMENGTSCELRRIPTLAQNARLEWGTRRVFQKTALGWKLQFAGPWLAARGSKLAASLNVVGF